MIVTCENCDKSFNLDEGLIKESGSKVKCSKCHHIFTVHKPVPVEEPDSALEEAPADLPVTGETPQPFLHDEEAPEEAAAVSGEAPEEILDFDLSGAEEEAAEEEISLEELGLEEEFASEEPSPIEEEIVLEEAPVAAEEAPEEILDFDLPGAEEEAAEEEISLEELGLEEEFASEEPSPIEEEIVLEEAPVAAEEAPEEDFDFDLSGAEEEAAEEEISFEELGLEEESASEEPSPIEEEIVLEEAPEAVESLEWAEEGEAEQVDEELMPPPVAEKKPRAKKRIGTPLMFMLVLVLLAGGAYGAYTLLQSLDIKIPYLESFIGAPESETIDPGNLRITTIEQLIKTKFVENSKTGLLLVIKGKVRNDYAEARNFIIVKGVIYLQDGKAVQEKTVYCGNTLSDADLQAMDKATIETRLRHRFGDKKSNFRVPSGKVLPFMIAFTDLPQDLGEFSVEVVSSSPG